MAAALINPGEGISNKNPFLTLNHNALHHHLSIFLFEMPSALLVDDAAILCWKYVKSHFFKNCIALKTLAFRKISFFINPSILINI